MFCIIICHCFPSCHVILMDHIEYLIQYHLTWKPSSHDGMDCNPNTRYRIWVPIDFCQSPPLFPSRIGLCELETKLYDGMESNPDIRNFCRGRGMRQDRYVYRAILVYFHHSPHPVRSRTYSCDLESKVSWSERLNSFHTGCGWTDTTTELSTCLREITWQVSNEMGAVVHERMHTFLL